VADSTRQLPQPSAAGGSRERLIAVVLGVIAGVVALQSAALDVRWVVIPLAGLFGGLFVMMLPDKERMLTAAFFLSLQANLSLRLMHGRAGSAGLAFPLTVVIGMAILGLYMLRGEFKHKRTWCWGGPMIVPICLYFGTLFVSLLTTSERFVGVCQLLLECQIYFVFLMTLNYIEDESDLVRVLKLLLMTLAMQSVVYYIQSALGITFTLTGRVIEQGEIARPGGTVSTVPAEFASFIIPLLTVAISLYLCRGRIINRTLLLGIVILGGGAIALTYTRAAWCSLLIGGAWVVFMGHRRRLLRPGAFAYVMAAVIAGTVIGGPLVAQRLAQSPLEESYDERKALMEMSYHVIGARPLTGVGPGAYGHTYKRYIPPELDDSWMFVVHNNYLRRTAESGIPGGIAFVFLLYSGIRLSLALTRSRRSISRALALGAGAGIVGLCFEMYWDTWQAFPYNAMLWLIFGLLVAAVKIEPDDPATTEAADS